MSEAIKFWLAKELVGIGLFLLAMASVVILAFILAKIDGRKK